MTEHDAALRFDQALDGTYTHDLNGVEPLVETAQTVQSLFDRQHAIPSEEFVMQLEQSLFPSIAPGNADGPLPTVIPSAPSVIPSAVEGSPAAAVRLRITPPRPTSIAPDIHRISRSRLAALAAVLVLLIGGMGAIFGGPLDPRSDPEPSAIPAASFGTVEASPEPVADIWTVSPPQGVEGSSGPAFIEDGLMYSILNGPSGPYAQVIDLETERALWSSRLAVSADLTAAVWQGLLLFTGTGGPNYELFAFDGRTGEEQWSIPLAQRPVNLIVDGDRAFVLGSGNLVVAIDLETQQELWRTDLSAVDPDWEPYGGMNRYGYFNDGRLALTNGVLAVVISNGQLIALDADDGSEEWTGGHANDGRTMVQVVAGQFAVTAEGKSIFEMEDDPYLMPASPVPSYDPKTQPCERTVEPRSATDSSALGDYETSVAGFDPTTGDPAWKVRTHAAVWIYQADSSRLMAMIRPGWDPAIGNDDFSIYCSIDGESGDVIRTSGIEFVEGVMTNPETGAPLGIGGTLDGLPLWVDEIDVDTATSFPRFDPDVETFSGVRWVQQLDDLVLITEQNGTVIGFPKDGPTWSPPIETSQSSWTVEPPPGISSSDRPLLISNGVALQTFMSGTLSPVQAVDLETGTALWTKLPRVATNVIGATGDLFLIAGGDGTVFASTYELIALDSRTGDELWSIELTSRPVGLLVSNGRVFVLGSNNLLDAFDLEIQQPLWQLDLSELDPSQADFGGANQSGDLTGDRITMTNGILGVIVSSGRLAAVDAADGTLQWADERATEGWTRVKVVDGKFVVLAFGAEMNMYDPDATPFPTAPHDPAVDPCTLTIQTRDGSTPETAFGIDETVDAFDPETGESPWGLRLPEQYWVWPLDDSRLIAQVESVESAGVADSADLINCLIDGSTGAVSETTGAEFATFAYGDDQTDEPWGMSVLSSGVPFGTGHLDPEVAKELPYFELDPETFSGFRWVQEVDDLILITAQDGTLIGLPKDAPRWSSANTSTPQSDLVVPAEIAWTAVGLEESMEWLSGHAIDDERLYLGYDTGNPDPGIVRALDLETGAELWSVRADVKARIMTVSDGLVLFGGMVLPMGQAEAVVALDAETGQEIWRAEISGRVAAMIVVSDRILVLTQTNVLNAIELASGQSIWTTNVGGRLKPSGSYLYSGDRRLAVIDDTLIAVLADGHVAGIDLDSGVGEWWALRDTPGPTDVVVVDGALIVLARGEPEISEYGTPGPATPVPSPVANASPVAVSCAHAVHVAPPDATIDGGELSPREAMIMRLDPETGLTLWNAKSEQLYRLDLESDAGVLSLIVGDTTLPIDRSQIALCATDPASGRVDTVERLADIVQRTFRLRSKSAADNQVYDIVGGSDSASGWILLPAEFDPSVPGPAIVVDELFVEGAVMVLSQGNAFYFIMEDGTVSKVVLFDDE